MNLITEKCLVCESPLKAHKLYAMGFAICSKCGCIRYLKAQSTRYEEDYFDKEYKEQYGRSYLEDRNNLQQRMRKRLEAIFCHAPKSGRLLEIGSAAGFFLEEAQKAGYEVCGWEISKTMSDYANQNKIPTQNGDFFTLYKSWQKKRQKGIEKPYELVCAYYVIEHIYEQKSFWEALARLVVPGGVLALAMPSSFGPMMKFHPLEWAKTHPKDHFLDYSPQSLSRVGQLYGFKTLFYQAEGVHPERFPFGRFFSFLVKKWQQKTGFSDTFFAILTKQTYETGN